MSRRSRERAARAARSARPPAGQESPAGKRAERDGGARARAWPVGLDDEFRRAVILILSLAGVTWVYLAWSSHGIFWPDEIYQSLEQGHRLAFGYGFIPWEFQLGARSWIFPGVLAAVLKVGAGLGVTTGEGIVRLAQTFMVALGLAGLYAIMRMAHRLGGVRAAIFAGALAGFAPTTVFFAGRCFSEVASAAVIAGSTLLALDGGRARLRTAGALAALAFFLRYQNGVFAAGLLGVLLVERRRGDVRPFLEGALAFGALGAALDWATWGAPLRPFFVYLRYNLIEGRASDYGTSPIWYYPVALEVGLGFGALLLVAGFIRLVPRTRRLLAVFALYLLAHSLVGHKSLRFILPVMPLAFVVAGVGLASWVARYETKLGAARATRVVWLVAAGASLVMGLRAPGLTIGEMGGEGGAGETERQAWRRHYGINRFLSAIGPVPDLCGVAVVGPSIPWFGGYSHLHRDVPLYAVAETVASKGWSKPPPGANYVILSSKLPPVPGGTRIGQSGEMALYRTPGPCGPPPPVYNRKFDIPPMGDAPRIKRPSASEAPPVTTPPAEEAPPIAR